jgi:hypothetical protein
MADYTPTPDEVADLMYPRTKTRGGNEIGEFTADTTPTLERVERLIVRAQDHLEAKVGVVDDPELTEDMKNAVIYYTGMLIELSSEQINKERYDELKELFDTVWKVVVEAVGATGSTAVDEELRGNAAANFYFDAWPHVGDAIW